MNTLKKSEAKDIYCDLLKACFYSIKQNKRFLDYMVKVVKVNKQNNPFIEEFFIDGSGYYELIKNDAENSKENTLNKIKTHLQEAQNQNILKNFDAILKKENEQFDAIYNNFAQKYKITLDEDKSLDLPKDSNNITNKDKRELKQKLKENSIKDKNPSKNEALKNAVSAGAGAAVGSLVGNMLNNQLNQRTYQNPFTTNEQNFSQPNLYAQNSIKTAEKKEIDDDFDAYEFDEEYEESFNTQNNQELNQNIQNIENLEQYNAQQPQYSNQNFIEQNQEVIDDEIEDDNYEDDYEDEVEEEEIYEEDSFQEEDSGGFWDMFE